MPTMTTANANIESDSHFGTSQEPGVPTSPKDAPRNYENIKQDLHWRLISKIDYDELNKIPVERRGTEIRLVLESMLDKEEPLLSLNDRDRIVREVVDEALGLGPLEMLLRDPSIDDILINGP